MNTRSGSQLARRVVPCALLLVLAACGGGGGGGSGDDGNDDNGGGTPNPTAVTVNGIVSDGPVSGGKIFVFASDQVQAAIEAADSSDDRAAALADASPLATVERDSADAEHFAIDIPVEADQTAVFLVFDNAGAQDEELRDVPPNLESVAILGAAGATQRVNVTTHTTLIAKLVRARLDPDGDGAPLDTAGVESEIATAQTQVLDAVGQDDLGRDLFPEGASPLDSEDDEVINEASSALGLLVRSAAVTTAASNDDVMEALAADAGDGAIDGAVPADITVSEEVGDLAQAVPATIVPGENDELDQFAVGACSSTAVALRKSCDAEVLQDAFQTRAACADEVDENAQAECNASADSDTEAANGACAEAFDARLALCTDVADAAHEPAFGADDAGRFVDPLQIGQSVVANPRAPLVPGNLWYRAGTATDDAGESVQVAVTTTVTERTKLIDGVNCIVVTNDETENSVLVQSREDWLAQDVDGNVWYCGQLVQSFESFDGDDPEEPELVSLDGSWKAGRDGAEAGMLMPAAPEVGAILRQEAAWGTAENVAEILDLDGSETAPGGFCVGTCLVTQETTALEPGMVETKHYMSGVGLLVDETDDERIELTEFHPAP
jgi:hypothetical protein